MFCPPPFFLSIYKAEVCFPFTLSGPQERHLWACAIIHWSLHGNLSAGCIVFESGLTFLKTTESFSVSENTARVSTAVQFQCSHHLAHHAYQTEGPNGSSRLPRCLCSWVCHLPLPCASPYMYVVLVFPLTVGVQALEQGKTAEGAH